MEGIKKKTNNQTLHVVHTREFYKDLLTSYARRRELYTNSHLHMANSDATFHGIRKVFPDGFRLTSVLAVICASGDLFPTLFLYLPMILCIGIKIPHFL